MHKVTISKLKATLCAELKRVRAGESVTVLDRTTPVAVLSPMPKNVRVIRKRAISYAYRELAPLTSKDPLEYLDRERHEKW